MKQIIKKLLIEDKGNMVVRRTTPVKINGFIEKLFPLQTEKPLIRLGPNGDGGYLLPDDLEGIDACFSPGVAWMSEFELDCVKCGMKVYMADKTVDKPNFEIAPERYHFLKKHIGCFDDEDLTTLDSWVNEYEPGTSDLLLQMDIEGAEYYSLLNVSEALMQRFRIVIIEFHDLHQLWQPHFFDLATQVFAKLLHSHSCVHIHPNNCYGSSSIVSQFGIALPNVVEFTFYRNDRIREKKYQTKFPHPLDRDNKPGEEPVSLPKNWYRS